jgi:hypothetical protein
MILCVQNIGVYAGDVEAFNLSVILQYVYILRLYVADIDLYEPIYPLKHMHLLLKGFMLKSMEL